MKSIDALSFLFLYVSFNLNEPLYILRRVRLLSLSFMAFDEAFPRARMLHCYSRKCLELSGRFNFKVNFNSCHFFFYVFFVNSLENREKDEKNEIEMKKKNIRKMFVFLKNKNRNSQNTWKRIS